MRILTEDEISYVAANAKPQANLPVLLTSAGTYKQISREVESWLLLLPNEVKQTLILLIDQTKKSISLANGLQTRLTRELADSQNLYFNQSRKALQEDISNYSLTLNYLKQGFTVTGDLTEDFIPTESLPLVSLLTLPVGPLLASSDVCEFEARHNEHVYKIKEVENFTSLDMKYLESWKEVISSYVDNSNVKTSTTTVTNTSSTSTSKVSTPTPTLKQDARNIVIQVAKKNSYPENWLLAQVYQESKYNPEALNSYSGAAGLGQFMKNTGPSYGLVAYTPDYFDARKNAEGTAMYMKSLIKYVAKLGVKSGNEQWKLALAAYNMGPSNLKKIVTSANLLGKNFTWSEVNEYLLKTLNFKETRGYVAKIEAYALQVP